ncbi:hypothetical protein BpHYR1_001567 [Brachionus plicatilis]|uniref:Uncharacterized protein n=1 Tax=Brachionus plicatilis TaxID=10195 RepID=A0A3M7Q9T3_BRAPC|nr:hypothetical protein BpHYR1_001567 [Brachionus plicatilis]
MIIFSDHLRSSFPPERPGPLFFFSFFFKISFVGRVNCFFGCFISKFRLECNTYACFESKLPAFVFIISFVKIFGKTESQIGSKCIA